MDGPLVAHYEWAIFSESSTLWSGSHWVRRRWPPAVEGGAGSGRSSKGKSSWRKPRKCTGERINHRSVQGFSDLESGLFRMEFRGSGGLDQGWLSRATEWILDRLRGRNLLRRLPPIFFEGERGGEVGEMGRRTVAVVVALWVVSISVVVDRIVPDPYMVREP